MRYFNIFAKLERQRNKCLKSDFPRLLAPLLQQPEWEASTDLREIEFLVLDFETTGLDICRDNILSIGWVIVKNGQINLESARKIDVFTTGQIKPEAAVINHIVSGSRIHSKSIHQAMRQLFKAMEGRAIIAHSVTIERGFFYQYCKRELNMAPIALLWLDTLRIGKSLVPNGSAQADYQLCSIRSKYGLPDYPGHDALVDALATAELFLAQVKSVFGREDPYLGPMVERS